MVDKLASDLYEEDATKKKLNGDLRRICNDVRDQ